MNRDAVACRTLSAFVDGSAASGFPRGPRRWQMGMHPQFVPCGRRRWRIGGRGDACLDGRPRCGRPMTSSGA